MKRIGQGNTAEIYADEDGKVLKLFRTGLSEYAVRQEYQNACIVSEVLGDQVPRVYGQIVYKERSGIIYEKIEGEDMLKRMLSDGANADAYSRKLAQYHVLIQRETKQPLPSIKEKLKNDIEAVPLLSDMEKRDILNFLSMLPEGDALCHFDFHPGNIILRNNKPVIIDWMTACKGTPHADAARTSVMLQYAKIPGTKKTADLAPAYIEEYLRITGTNREQMKEWYLPIMAARLREWIPEEEKKVLLSEIKKLLFLYHMC